MPSSLIARGPLLEIHRRGNASLTVKDGWEFAAQYPADPPKSAENILIDVSHQSTWEFGGPKTGELLAKHVGQDVPLRRIHVAGKTTACRLTPTRAIVFGPLLGEAPDAVDVTGGWASVSLKGPDAETILNKVTAVDLRERTLPVLGCCQGPVFGVNTLFCRFEDRFDLHVCPDSMQFFWEVLLDAGREFGLRPSGAE